MLEALQEVDVRPPLVAVLRARPARRLLIEISVRALRRKSGGHRSEIACRINRTMTGTRSPPPLSPLRPDNPHRTLHTELLIHPFSSRAQVNFMLAGVERLRQVQQGAAARHAHELCGGHRLRRGEATAAGGIARVR